MIKVVSEILIMLGNVVTNGHFLEPRYILQIGKFCFQWKMQIAGLPKSVLGVVNLKPLTNPRIYTKKLHKYFVTLHGIKYIVVYVLRNKRR